MENKILLMYKILENILKKIEFFEREEEKNFIRYNEERLKILEGIKEFKNNKKPNPDEIAFINRCFRYVTKGKVIYAEMVKEYRKLYSLYKEYFKKMHWPDDIRNKNCQRRILDKYEDQEFLNYLKRGNK